MWACVCFSIHSVATRCYEYEGCLAILYVTFTYKPWLLSTQHVGDSLPKAAASLLEDSKGDATGYSRIVTIGSVPWMHLLYF